MQVMAFYREIVESEGRLTLPIRIPFLIHKRLLIMWTGPHHRARTSQRIRPHQRRFAPRRILERLSQSAGPIPRDTLHRRERSRVQPW